MDRTSWIGLIVCLIILFGVQLMVVDPHYREEAERVRKAQQEALAQREAEALQGGEAVADSNEADPQDSAERKTPATRPILPGNLTTPSDTAPIIRPPRSGSFEEIYTLAEKLPEAQIAELRNEYIVARFSTHGGTLKDVELLDHDHEDGGKVDLNKASPLGVFNLVNWWPERIVPFELVSSSETDVVFERKLDSSITIRRQYTLSEESGYIIKLNQTVINNSDDDVNVEPYRVNVGTAGPSFSNGQPYYIGATWLDNNGAFIKNLVTSFSEFNILGIHFWDARDNIASDENDGPLQWVAVKNQFFTILMLPPDDRPFVSAECQPVQLPFLNHQSQRVPKGVQAEAWMSGFTLAAGESKSDEFKVYAGPRSYVEVQKIGHDATHIMDFGMFYIVIVPLLHLLTWIHDFLTGSWGWAIVVMTIIIKAVTWPLGTIANINAKKMQAIQPLMEKLKEKYKDDPEKQQKEMFGLFKTYGVNPLGGCLPMLIQIPIFISFYYLLLSAVELRGDSFLWIHDLTLPDTVAVIGGFPINPLPILMAASQFFLMRMTPMPKDNPQMQVLQFMPLLLLFILYYFAAALALYWTLSNLISMFQTYVNLRTPMPELENLKQAQAARSKKK